MTSSSAVRPDRGVALWRNALLVVFGVCGLSLGGWMARMPAMKQALDIDTAQTGLVISALAIGSVLGLALAGPLVGRFGARAVIASTLVGMSAGLVVAGAGANVASFAVAYGGLLLYGVALGMCDVAMNVSGALNERALGKTFLPVLHAFFSIGALAGAGLGALTETLGASLLMHALVLATGILLPGAFAVRHVRSESREAEPTESRVSMRETWADPRTYLIGLIVLGMGLAEGSATDWLAVAMVDGHGTDNTTGALVFALFMVAMTVGRLVGGPILDRFGRVPVLRISAALSAAGLAVFIFVPVTWVAIVGVVLWGLGTSLGFPTGMSAAADDPRTASARVSAVALIGYVAYLVGPPALGFLGEQVGILLALTLVLAFIVVSGLSSPAARERTIDG